MRTAALILVTAAWLAAGADREVIADNDRVKVLKVGNTPGQKSGMHRHAVNRVMVHLDAGSLRLVSQDGTARVVQFKAGEARWDPVGGLHTSENTSGQSIRIVEIELKKPGPAAGVRFPDLDPVRVDPRHYRVEFENEQVRVIRARFGPREGAPLHEHGLPRVVVHLTPMKMRITAPDGTVREGRASAGDVVWSGTARHSELSLQDEPFEVAVVEVK